MRDKKGVTLISLTIYVIALIIVLVILTFISANFTSQIMQVSNRGKVANENLKLYSFLISDIKAADSVVEFSDEYVRFDNDVKYYAKYIENNADEKMQYEIYRNNVLIAENILDINFDYDVDERILSLNLKYIYDSLLVEKSGDFMVGRGY